MSRLNISQVTEAQSSFVSLAVLPGGYQRPAVQIPKPRQYREYEDVQTLSTTLRLPVFKMLRIIPPARLATATDEDTRRIKKSGVPAAMIAGGNQVVSREK